MFPSLTGCVQLYIVVVLKISQIRLAVPDPNHFIVPLCQFPVFLSLRHLTLTPIVITAAVFFAFFGILFAPLIFFTLLSPTPSRRPIGTYLPPEVNHPASLSCPHFFDQWKSSLRRYGSLPPWTILPSYHSFSGNFHLFRFILLLD